MKTVGYDWELNLEESLKKGAQWNTNICSMYIYIHLTEKKFNEAGNAEGWGVEVVVSLILIKFIGGLESNMQNIRSIWRETKKLSDSLICPGAELMEGPINGEVENRHAPNLKTKYKHTSTSTPWSLTGPETAGGWRPCSCCGRHCRCWERDTRWGPAGWPADGL